MPVNRMLTCWCGFVQREYDRSATENTATRGTVALKAAWHVCGLWTSVDRDGTARWRLWRKKGSEAPQLLFSIHFAGSGLMCREVCTGITLMLHFSVLGWRRYTMFSSWVKLKLWLAFGWGGSQQDDCCALFTNLSSKQNKREVRRDNNVKAVMGSHVLPRSLIRGSTLVVKLLYEATFPSGEAMPTWASYILRLVGFFGRGWICWRGNRNSIENHDRLKHFFLKNAKNTVHLVSNYELMSKTQCGLSGSSHQYLTTEADNGSAHVKY